MNEKRPAIPPPRKRPIPETLPQPSATREEPAAPEVRRRRRRYSDPQPEAPPADLPPLDDEGFSMKKLLRSLAGYLFMISLLGGLLYLYLRSIEKEATTVEILDSGLRGIAQELWIKGEVPGVSSQDPKLSATIARIKKTVAIAPSISIVPAEGVPSERAITHEILYISGSRSLLTLRVYADISAGMVDIVSFTAAPQFQEEEKRKAPGAEETLEEKLRRFGVDEKVLQDP